MSRRVKPAPRPNGPEAALRQMIAVLHKERQALADLDLNGLVGSAEEKQSLCGALDHMTPATLPEECRSLAESARQMNEVNRRIRNLLAANVAMRLEMIGGTSGLYRPR